MTATRSLPVKEADLVRGICEGLLYRKRIVLRCGQYRADKAGSDPGIGDILVWDADRQGWLMLETKTPTGTLRKAQRALVDVGAVIVCRSLEDAFAACNERLP